MKLYEFNPLIEKIREKYDKGEIDLDTFQDTVESLELTRNEKLDNLASWFEDNSTTIEFADKKAKEWQKEKKRLTNLNNRIMRYMTETIDEAGVKQIKTENHILKPRSFRESTIIDDTELIPKTYIKTEVVNKLDKKAIYQALRDGEEVEGAHLEPNRKTRIL